MAPDIVLDSMTTTHRSLRVLDPMAGSGTVLALARSLGHRAIGFDLDPLAVLMAKVWTTPLDRDVVRRQGYDVLKRAQAVADDMNTEQAFPLHADDETRAFVRYWFDARARKQLSALAQSIHRIRNGKNEAALWCALSRLIIAKQAGASRAMDLSHSRPHRVFARAPVLPFDAFHRAVDKVLASCIGDRDAARGPKVEVLEGDARRLPVESSSIDLIITSPPYLNAIDYMRCSKFSLVWMGHRVSELRRIRSESVGAEVSPARGSADTEIHEVINALKLRPKLANRQSGMLTRYVADMRMSLKEASRVLRPGGRAVYVIGENTIHGTFIPNAAIVEAVASLAGLRTSSVVARMLPASRRYMPPPARCRGNVGLDGRMRREVVLSLVKPRSVTGVR